MTTPTKTLLSLTAGFLFLIFIVVAYQKGLTQNLSSQVNTPAVIPSITPIFTVSPSASDLKATAGWSTFENKDLGFSFKYPNTWKKENRQGTMDYIWFPSKGGDPIMNLAVIDNPSVSLEDQAQMGLAAYDIIKKTTIGSTPVIISAIKENNSYKAVFQLKNYYLELSIEGTKTVLGDNPDVLLNQILSTLKFTNSNSSDLKTYSNSNLGFEFNYPSKYTFQAKIRQGGDSGQTASVSLSSPGSYQDFTLGGITRDFAEGRSGTFTDMSGYIRNADQVDVWFTANRTVPLTNPKEIKTNSNGVEIILIQGTSTAEDTMNDSPGQLGPGYVGVYFNTKNSKFPGFAIKYKTGSKYMSRSDFDQIVDSIKLL